MKQIAGILLLGLGIAAVVLCLVLRFQFSNLATQENPTLGDYPLLQMVVPEPPPSSGPAKPADLARAVSFRINGIGVVGVLLVVAGIAILLIRGHNRP